jgi:thiol-disulfide isomerase/thioredoxin
MNCASAQGTTHFVTGSIAEKSLVEMQLVQEVNGTSRKIADYSISPRNRDFAFIIPGDSGATYRLQVNLMKLEGRHPKLYQAFNLRLLLNPAQNYTLYITPSKLNSKEKSGWQLKQHKESSPAALVTGKILNVATMNGFPVSLEKVEDGQLVTQCTVQSNTNGEFSVSGPVKREGFYYLSTGRFRVRVYLKPADRIQLEVDNRTGNLSGLEGSVENLRLYEWQRLISPITSYGYNLGIINTDTVDMDDYIRRYESLQPSMAGFLAATDKSNAQFTKAMKNAIEVDCELAPIYYLLYKSAKKVKGYRPLPKDFNEVPSFYQQFIQPGKFPSASILIIGEARQLMNLYAKLNMASLPAQERLNLSQSARLSLMMKAISNDTLKSFFFNDQMGQIEVNNLSEFKETFEPFKRYAKLSPAKETYQEVYRLFSDDTAYIGKTAYNFSLPDTSGNIVSMKDFKGKVVFVDVWATWCGPCRAQFPFLKQIEEEYASNKDIVFVGISLDKVDVKQKWKDMIKKENLGGIQLLDDFGKGFGRKYDIAAIPRFLLIDRQGRWIEIRCPKPEAKDDLKRYLDRALAE